MQFPTEMNTIGSKTPTHFIHNDNMMITAQRRINGITFRKKNVFSCNNIFIVRFWAVSDIRWPIVAISVAPKWWSYVVQ